jgi:hypothetical protein
MALGATTDDLQGFSVGIGGEGNGYSIAGNVGVGIGVDLDYRFEEWFGLGAQMIFNFDKGKQEDPYDDGNLVTTGKLFLVESSVFARLYFLRFTQFRDWFFDFSRVVHPFLQGNVGIWFARIDSEKISDFLYYAELGIRFQVENLYFEPYVRYGKPVTFGAGLLLGYRIGKNW